jgi:hypothetical protein
MVFQKIVYAIVTWHSLKSVIRILSLNSLFLCFQRPISEARTERCIVSGLPEKTVESREVVGTIS